SWNSRARERGNGAMDQKPGKDAPRSFRGKSGSSKDGIPPERSPRGILPLRSTGNDVGTIARMR
ncbi:MAG: hypothetical protein H6Q83_1528, partial [Deltaproteobacteria bacterium]|nr:hypothetical protein [Deltaproteobacteria bacterium]